MIKFKLALALATMIIGANSANAATGERYTVQSFLDQNKLILSDGELNGEEYLNLSPDLLSCLKNEHSKTSRREYLNPQSNAIILKLISEGKQTSNYDTYEDYFRVEAGNCFSTMNADCFRLSPKIDTILNYCDLLLSEEDAANLLASVAAAAVNDNSNKLKELLIQSKNIISQEFKDNLLYNLTKNSQSANSIEVLLANGANANSHYQPLINDNISKDIFDLLLRYGANPNVGVEVFSHRYKYPLIVYLASTSVNRMDLVKSLLNIGVDPKQIITFGGAEYLRPDKYRIPTNESVLLAIRALNWDIDDIQAQQFIAQAICSSDNTIEEAAANDYDFTSKIEWEKRFGFTISHDPTNGGWPNIESIKIPAYFLCSPTNLKAIMQSYPDINFHEMTLSTERLYKHYDKLPYSHFWKIEDSQLINLMIARGWNINQRYSSSFKHLGEFTTSPLMDFMSKGLDPSILINLGAKIEPTDNIWVHNFTSSRYGIRDQGFDGYFAHEIKNVIRLGFNPNLIVDEFGNTPLLRLAKTGDLFNTGENLELVEALLSSGKIDCNIKNKNGESVTDILKINKNPYRAEYKKLLKKYCKNL